MFLLYLSFLFKDLRKEGTLKEYRIEDLVFCDGFDLSVGFPSEIENLQILFCLSIFQKKALRVYSKKWISDFKISVRKEGNQ